MSNGSSPRRALLYVSDATLRESLRSLLAGSGFVVHSADDRPVLSTSHQDPDYQCVVTEGDQTAPPSAFPSVSSEAFDGAPSPFLSSSAASMREALNTVSRAASSSVSVLLRGESGTGKGVVAEWIHAHSSRRDGPFVIVNCPALSDELLTAELFGHARGSFTGAVRDKPGRVEVADGGTLFLDEIGDLSPALQVKLLRYLQDQTFERLGELKTRRSNVRIVAATNRNLEADVESGRLRVDLYYRLNVVEVRLPALRERRDDILPLTEHLLRAAAGDLARPRPLLTDAARALLAAHSWPGNVRELKNEIDRALALCSDPILDAACFSERLRASVRGAGPQLGGDHSLREIEREHIDRVLARAPSFEAAAQVLGIDDSTLWRKRKRFGDGHALNAGVAHAAPPAPRTSCSSQATSLLQHAAPSHTQDEVSGSAVTTIQ